MDLNLNPDESRFKEAITLFIDSYFPLAVREHLYPADLDRWRSAVSKQGWTAPEWDTKAGGPGWSPGEIYLWYSLTIEARCPQPDYCALQIVGPLLHRHANNALHERELGQILNQSVIWGSALFPGDVEITATRSGNGFELSGNVPCFLSEGVANRMLVLCSSEDGYSLIMVDTKTIGVGLVPDRSSNRLSMLNMDRVQVSGSALVGTYGKGLDHLVHLLSEEQSISTALNLRPSLTRLKYIVSESSLENEFESQVAGHEIELEGLEITGLRSLFNDDGKMLLPVNSRVEKLRIKISESITNALGYYAIPQPSMNPGENEPATFPDQDVFQIDPFTGCPEGFREDLVARIMLGL